jgi:prephenate dehydrogenase
VITIESAGVVGLGLIGGSIARDLVARGVRVAGYDRDAAWGERSSRAPARAALDGVAVARSIADVAAADLLVLAVPVSAAPALLADARPHLGRTRLVIDVGSTKRTIVAAAEALGIGDRFVGCHPMAGDHRSGWEASRAGLFAGARTYLCPTPRTSAAALGAARDLWLSLGASPECLDAAEHDRRLGFTSHLPHVVASALALTLDAAGLERAEMGPGGRGATRLAGSSPELWSAIAADNADSLGEALAALETQLAAMRASLAGGDAERVAGFFAAAREWFERSDRGEW